MPRLATSLIKQAKRIHPLLPLLLQPCRSLESARNELRWLAEYQRQLKPRKGYDTRRQKPLATTPPTLRDLCIERSHGRPLQYILGTQPFGELEIICRKGVFIPRATTESYVNRLSHILSNDRSPVPLGARKPKLKIADLCTGTGCILLLLYAKLSPYYNIKAVGVDLSERALRLARRNLLSNIACGALPKDAAKHISFRQMDVLDGRQVRKLGKFDIVTINPPYISESELRTQTERSVRIFEPRTALVPGVASDRPGIILYSRESKRLFDAEKGGLLLLECLDEVSAGLYMYQVFQRASSACTDQRPIPPYMRQTDVFLWREGNAGPAQPPSEVPSKASLRIAHPTLRSNAQAAFSTDSETGPLQAVVVSHGFRDVKKFYRESEEATSRAGKLSMETLNAPAEDHTRRARKDRHQDAEPESGAQEQPTPTGHLDAPPGKPPEPERRASTREAAVLVGLVRSISQSVNQIHHLSAALQERGHVHSQLREEQAAVGRELKKLSERLQK